MMSKRDAEEQFFERMAKTAELAAPSSVKAPSRLKAKVYSTLVRHQTASGPLLSISDCEAGGRSLCVFEKTVEILPVGEEVKSLNFCRVCHARLAAEQMEDAPIYWPHCPYVSFQNR